MLSKKNKFPYLRDRSVYLAVKLSKKANPEDFAYSLIRIPRTTISRFLVLPKEGKKIFVMMLDDVIRYCFEDLFFYFDYDFYEAYTIKVTRDAEQSSILTTIFLKVLWKRWVPAWKKGKKGNPFVCFSIAKFHRIFWISSWKKWNWPTKKMQFRAAATTIIKILWVFPK